MAEITFLEAIREGLDEEGELFAGVTPEHEVVVVLHERPHRPGLQARTKPEAHSVPLGELQLESEAVPDEFGQ